MKLGTVAIGVLAVMGFAGSALANEVCGAPDGLNFRSGPSLHAHIDTVLDDGAPFKVIGHAAGGWDKIRRANGQVGFVYSAYVCRHAASHGGGKRVAGDSRWRNPVMGTCISSGFGRRVLNGRVDYHPGLDLNAHCGQPIKAAAPGVVVFAGYGTGAYQGYGNIVVIYHPASGVYSMYGHMERIYAHPGERPGPNTIIGLTGQTGYAFGCHVHFEVRHSRYGAAFNPASLIGGGECPRVGRASGGSYLAR